MKSCILLAGLVVVITGCASVQAPSQRYYRLEALPASSAVDFAATIVLSPIEVYGVAAERPLLYRASADSRALEQYHYSLWAEPPAVLLHDVLAVQLRGALGDGRVLLLDTRLPAGYRIRTRLKRLEQILDKTAPRAVLALEFTVSAGRGEALFMLDFSQEAAAAGLSVEDHVAALEKLLAQAGSELVQRLIQVAAALP